MNDFVLGEQTVYFKNRPRDEIRLSLPLQQDLAESILF